jgi:D-alanyl-lipoteichoic acid acyltransferase DltB (MBOAT superfamily)
MLFNSIEFLIFFPLVTAIYFLVPHRFRWIHLLAASCVFYMFFIPVYIFILIFTIVIDYIAGIMIENAEGTRRKMFLAMSIIANIGVLAVFKYFNFFTSNVNELLAGFHMTGHSLPLLKIILPIGLSFHTFQAMSYTIEVYRRHQKAERHFGIYSLYVMFYPQLVAGPIERPQNLLPQFRTEHFFDYDKVTSGLRLMAWGMFKKVVIADRLAIIVNGVYDHPQDHHGISVLIAMLFFSIQIYCDFSGYSDIAIGSARVMGFTLMRNFRTPYFSKNIAEFWKRWHISLSTWFRDYLYISLGGNRMSRWRSYLNQFIVFIVSGFWHGANWTFIIWGGLHGTFVILARIAEPARKRIRALIGVNTEAYWFRGYEIITTFILVTIAWVFFRADSFRTALSMFVYLRHGLKADISAMVHTRRVLDVIGFFQGIDPLDWAVIIVSVGVLFAVDWMQFRMSVNEWLVKRNVFFRWAIYFGIVYFILFLGKFESQQFIYFQF